MEGSSFPNSQTIETQMALLSQSMQSIKESINKIEDSLKKLAENSVTSKEFQLLEASVQAEITERVALQKEFNDHINDYAIMKSRSEGVYRVVYGVTSLFLATVVTALAALVINFKP